MVQESAFRALEAISGIKSRQELMDCLIKQGVIQKVDSNEVK